MVEENNRSTLIVVSSRFMFLATLTGSVDTY